MLPGKILVVDDELLIRKTTCLLLNSENIATISAANGNEGITLARSDKPDMILLDIVLPDMDGWEVMKVLKSDPLTKNIPIVLFTATDCEISEQHAKEKGAAGILHKPFYVHQLLDVISNL
jgi:CheY-like chemotaxis protein